MKRPARKRIAFGFSPTGARRKSWRTRADWIRFASSFPNRRCCGSCAKRRGTFRKFARHRSRCRTCDAIRTGRRLSRTESVLVASLIAAADGARSRTAALAGVGVCARTFGQSALSATLRAPLPPDAAAQWFFRDNILALLPVGDGNFSLIWSLPQAEANRLANVGADELAKAVAAQTGTADIAAADAEVAMFPLAASRRAVRVAERVAFAGDSARTIHPLAGQGLNLALLDAEDLIARASSFSDWGDASALSSYAASRSLRAEALHRATAFFAESGGAAGTILAAANIVRPALHAAARFANGY